MADNFAVYEHKPKARRWKHGFYVPYESTGNLKPSWHRELCSIEQKFDYYNTGRLFDEDGYVKMLALLQKHSIRVISQEEHKSILKAEEEAREAADTRDDVQKAIDEANNRCDRKWYGGWWQYEDGLKEELREHFDYSSGDYEHEPLLSGLKDAQQSVFDEIKRLQRLADELHKPIDILVNRPADYYD